MSKLYLRRAVCVFVALHAVTAIVSSAQTFTTLASFDGANGANPQIDPLVQGLDGNFYGTTAAGGASGYGTVFKVTPDGSVTMLHSFDSTDGAYPTSRLVHAPDGTLYGTTCNGGDGDGTIFRITQAGTLTSLYAFNSVGACPGSLVRDANGNLYGTTMNTIFKLTPHDSLTTLYTFGSGYSFPSGLVLTSNGDLYGVTEFGGTDTLCSAGCGTVFKLAPGGTLTTLHNFSYSDGAMPTTRLVQATNGIFYGTTTAGAGTSNAGTIFSITPDGTFKTMYVFDVSNGQSPLASLIQGTDGDLYGATYAGGTEYNGTIFKITRGGTLTTLHDFSFQSPDGANPQGGLLLATDGSFYGTTYRGGSSNEGIVYRLSTGLGPFVKTLPHAGKVGDAITILGTDLTGATAVTFNRVAAEFTVVSATEITTTVPQGATTGSIQVTMPTGTLLASGGPFYVLR